MIAPFVLVSAAAAVTLAILGIAFVLTAYRVITGPTLPDRILALDTLTGIAIGFIAVIAVKTRFTLYIDIAIALGLVGFLATVAFARFVLSRGRPETRPLPAGDEQAVTPVPGDTAGKAR
ncbi:Na+/H+ antiporter subunit F [Rhizobium etli 8C-3]|uniref:Na+/H+ antiporter subunit F n=2 Tax=Rhizobium TaxID=379 RepID=A0A1L5P1K6_RHIET|nr:MULTISPECIES: cation:proton antiporter [Rhizobium]APO73991.1 Na+/H+ antiporter subunit F [Rhizobium etli 8C-3]TCU34446.1 multicomponent Na+:H+ antiporter subunit F [Rhizobium azibense]